MGIKPSFNYHQNMSKTINHKSFSQLNHIIAISLPYHYHIVTKYLSCHYCIITVRSTVTSLEVFFRVRKGVEAREGEAAPWIPLVLSWDIGESGPFMDDSWENMGYPLVN